MVQINSSLYLLLITITLLPYQIYAQINCLDGNNDVTVPQTVRGDLYRGQQAFTVDMLKAIQSATPNENIFFSPYSTYHALLLAYFGARGATEKELIQTLRLQWAQNKNHVQRGYRVEKSSRYSRSKKMPLEFASADKIYFDKHVQLTDCILDNFNDEIEKLDFYNNYEESRNEVNSWIANITRNEIRNMLKAGDVNSDTQLLLANAAYFKGKWSNQFDPIDTSMDVFHTSQSNRSLVDFMRKTGTYSFTVDERLKAQILQIPYVTKEREGEESDVSMVIILPPSLKNSLETVLERLTPDTLEMALKESMPREVELALPKFEFEQNTELVPILNRMGINKLFNSDADLSAFSPNSSLNFGDAKHTAKIKVDEEGSTAAAATILFSFRSARPIEPTVFKCDHPFIFLIYDHYAKAVLFAGIYRDPKTRSEKYSNIV